MFSKVTINRQSSLDALGMSLYVQCSDHEPSELSGCLRYVSVYTVRGSHLLCGDHAAVMTMNHQSSLDALGMSLYTQFTHCRHVLCEDHAAVMTHQSSLDALGMSLYYTQFGAAICSARTMLQWWPWTVRDRFESPPLNIVSFKDSTGDAILFSILIWLDYFPLLSQRTLTRNYFPISPNWQ